MFSLLKPTIFILIMLPLSLLATPLNTLYKPHKVESYAGHAFIQKCIGTSELPAPEVTTPKIDVTEDKETASRLFNIQFNGEDLKPILRINSKKIVLEKTSDQRGYFITLTKPSALKEFNLVFELHNKNSETILHVLRIGQSSAELKMYPNDEQRQRLCIRDQMWVGFGVPSITTTQYNYNDTINGDIKSATEASSTLWNVEYRKTLTSKFALHISYRNADSKVKTSATSAAPANNKQKWTTIDGSLVWRNINWSLETQNTLYYPYVKIGYQNQSIPVFHLNSTGAAVPVNVTQQSVVSGFGISIFSKSNLLIESGINLKWLIDGVEKSNQSLDGYIGISKVLQNNFSLGLNLTAARERLAFKTEEENYLNNGNLDFTAATVDLRLGWVF